MSDRDTEASPSRQSVGNVEEEELDREFFQTIRVPSINKESIINLATCKELALSSLERTEAAQALCTGGQCRRRHDGPNTVRLREQEERKGRQRRVRDKGGKEKEKKGKEKEKKRRI
jgi:hypothetical protein